MKTPRFLFILLLLSLRMTAATYDAARYFVAPQMWDNADRLQALVDRAHQDGGGTILLGTGEYTFRHAVRWRSGVALEGVSVQGTVLKMVGNANWSLFIGESTRQGTFPAIESVRFEHFTVDGYGMHPTSYATDCKAFNIRPLTDAVFNDLVLRGTPATSLGVDFLNRVYINNVRVIEGGRLWKPGNGGGSGIGIGLRGYADENFTVTNCICVGCGNNGIFVEDQSRFGNGINGRTPMTEGKGQIIQGNIVRDGRNHGISVQGARHISILGNLSYSNAGAGFYGNYFMSDVLISGNQLLDNRWGIYICPASNVKGFSGTGEFRDITIQGNVLRRNQEPVLLDIPGGIPGLITDIKDITNN